MGVRTAATLTVLLALVASACDGGDDDAGDSTSTTTAGDATTAAPATTVPETTTSSTTTSTSTTTTSTTTPEQAEEALKAQIAADYERAFYESWELAENPTLDGLEDKVSRLAVPGSPAYEGLVSRARELVQSGDRFVPNEPDLLTVTVEQVELVGASPSTEALVTACQVSNRRQIAPSPVTPASPAEVLGTGRLTVFRVREGVRLTESGWLPYEAAPRAEVFDEGETTCPPG